MDWITPLWILSGTLSGPPQEPPRVTTPECIVWCQDPKGNPPDHCNCRLILENLDDQKQASPSQDGSSPSCKSSPREAGGVERY